MGGKAIGIAESEMTFDSVTVTGALNVGGAQTVTGNQVVSGNLTVKGNAAIGDAAADLLAFYGVTPVAQQAATNQAAPVSTAAVSVTATQWGFSTSTQASAIVNCLIEVRTALVTLGLIKGSN